MRASVLYTCSIVVWQSIQEPVFVHLTAFVLPHLTLDATVVHLLAPSKQRSSTILSGTGMVSKVQDCGQSCGHYIYTLLNNLVEKLPSVN